VGEWQNMVTTNRLAEQLTFPINRSDIKMATAKDFTDKFKPKTNLEEKVYSILSASPHTLADTRELSAFEQQVMDAMSLEEALERRGVFRKMKAMQDRMAVKANRQNKIKSKIYHRIRRRDKIRKQLKEFENLQKTDPAAALEKLNEIQRERATERMNLRRRNTGKWAKNQTIRAKYNPEAREALKESLQLSREITQKVNTKESSDSEDDADDADGEKGKTVDDKLMHGYKKYWDQVTKDQPEKSNTDKVSINSRETPASNTNSNANNTSNVSKETPQKPGGANNANMKPQSRATSSFIVSKSSESGTKNKCDKSWDIENMFDEMEDKLNYKIKSSIKKLEDSESSDSGDEDHEDKNKVDKTLVNDGKDRDFMDETRVRKRTMEDYSNMEPAQNDAPNLKLPRLEAVTKKKESGVYVDPDKVLRMPAHKLKSAIPEIMHGGDDDNSDDDTSMNNIIAQAFADDDVVADFKKEKSKIVDADKPSEESEVLPGWGSWGGGGLKPHKPQTKRDNKPRKPRKDGMLGNIIINENAAEKLKKHQVSDIPYPFTSVSDYQASVRQPIGKNWVPETVFKKLTLPKVVTKTGTIIPPLDRSALVNEEKVQMKTR